MSDPKKALAALNALVASLDRRHPGAAASLLEGLEETLTINELGVTLALARTLGNTNTFESANSVARTVMRNVKRWRDGAMAERWTAAGMLVAEAQFRRVMGYKDLGKLVAALHARTARLEGVSVADATVAYSSVGSSPSFNGERDIPPWRTTVHCSKSSTFLGRLNWELARPRFR
jgi:hypothetical protein